MIPCDDGRTYSFSSLEKVAVLPSVQKGLHRREWMVISSSAEYFLAQTFFVFRVEADLRDAVSVIAQVGALHRLRRRAIERPV